MSSPLSVRLPDATAKALEELARPTDGPKTYFVEKALESYLAEHADYARTSEGYRMLRIGYRSDVCRKGSPGKEQALGPRPSR